MCLDSLRLYCIFINMQISPCLHAEWQIGVFYVHRTLNGPQRRLWIKTGDTAAIVRGIGFPLEPDTWWFSYHNVFYVSMYKDKQLLYRDIQTCPLLSCLLLVLVDFNHSLFRYFCSDLCSLWWFLHIEFQMEIRALKWRKTWTAMINITWKVQKGTNACSGLCTDWEYFYVGIYRGPGDTSVLHFPVISK